MSTGRKAGILGILGMLVLLVCTVISAVSFEGGAFSLTNSFISDLGFYYHGYFVMSPALLLNFGMIASGLIICAFSVMYGIHKSTSLDTASSFFGILSGVTLAAQGLITLNYSRYHLLILAAFFASVFLMCVFTVISQVRYRQGSSLAVCIIAFITGAAAALSSVYILAGGLDNKLGSGAAGASRADIMPCAIIQWGVYALLVLMLLIQSVMAVSGNTDAQEEYEPEPSRSAKRWHGSRDIEI